MLRFVLRLGQGQVNQEWTLRTVLRPGEGILVTCGAEVAIQVHKAFLMPPVAPSAWEHCPSCSGGAVMEKGTPGMGQQLQSREELGQGRAAGGCGKAAPGTIPGSVRTQLVWLGPVQLGSKSRRTE